MLKVIKGSHGTRPFNRAVFFADMVSKWIASVLITAANAMTQGLKKKHRTVKYHFKFKC